MASSKFSGNVPPWVLIGVACLGVVILGIWGWRSLSGGEPSAGASKPVHPGMYDLRAEVAKRNAAQQGAGVGQNGKQ